MASVKVVKDVYLGNDKSIKVSIEAELPSGVVLEDAVLMIRNALSQAHLEAERNLLYGLR